MVEGALTDTQVKCIVVIKTSRDKSMNNFLFGSENDKYDLILEIIFIWMNPTKQPRGHTDISHDRTFSRCKTAQLLLF